MISLTPRSPDPVVVKEVLMLLVPAVPEELLPAASEIEPLEPAAPCHEEELPPVTLGTKLSMLAPVTTPVLTSIPPEDIPLENVPLEK